jgi:hypothetical protein
MTRHLKTCGLPDAKRLAVTGSVEQSPRQSFHLFVEGRYNKAYWIHLAAPAETRLAKVDAFLRHVWLECCGHLSAFTIEGRRYSSQPMRGEGESGMEVQLRRVLRPGMVFTYEYDFGSTTELNLKVPGLWDRGTHRSEVELLAQNDAPAVACDQCGSQPAAQICTACQWKGQGWLCESCAAEHECGEEMFLPVVNSPRAGVCAYAG